MCVVRCGALWYRCGGPVFTEIWGGHSTSLIVTTLGTPPVCLSAAVHCRRSENESALKRWWMVISDQSSLTYSQYVVMSIFALFALRLTQSMNAWSMCCSVPIGLDGSDVGPARPVALRTRCVCRGNEPSPALGCAARALIRRPNVAGRDTSLANRLTSDTDGVSLWASGLVPIQRDRG